MACCQGLAPSATMFQVKKNLGKNRMRYQSTESTTPDPNREDRLVPISRFKSRIGVAQFDKPTQFMGDIKIQQEIFILPLSQHVGKPSVPVVKPGDKVSAGQMIARADEGISAALHTPVSGTVSAVTGSQIEITADEVK